MVWKHIFKLFYLSKMLLEYKGIFYIDPAMKVFYCQHCQHQVFFNNTHCENCHALLGYDVENKTMGTFEQLKDGRWKNLDAQHPDQFYKPCYNYQHHQVCNWMLAAESNEIYCASCRLTHIIPDLSIAQNKLYWQHLEQAKRRFLYLTQQLNIFPRPKVNDQDQKGLRFNFLMPLPDQPVITGHQSGTITLNASEADIIHLEKTRLDMQENYRTVLGHFRHESGHYYFDLMTFLYPEWLHEFRIYFGDERQDYTQALAKYYQNGPIAHWQEFYISRYACAHPWEDWAESWAHYLHMMDTLDTAYHTGMCIEASHLIDPDMHFKESPIGSVDFEHTLTNWFSLSYALNALNRSMGLQDAYPFTLSSSVLDKLRFIHRTLMKVALKPEIRTSKNSNQDTL